jgi:hypothetical protein
MTVLTAKLEVRENGMKVDGKQEINRTFKYLKSLGYKK